MKTIKVQVFLLSLVAVLTLGLTSCSDELGDNTTGKPGYLTLNLKTLKPKATKLAGDSINDYKFIKDLNVFIFDGSDNLILDKYYSASTTPALPAVTGGSVAQISIKVNSLPTGAYAVVVANYGSRITITGTNNITNLTSLTNLEVPTIKDFATDGLYMTGQADITSDATGFIYTSNVKVAPIVSKIVVKCNLLEDVLSWYDLTGIYIVNAIDKTKLPIIRNVTGSVNNDTIRSLITPGTKTASSGLPTITDAASGLARDYHFYTGLTGNVPYLKDEGISLPLTAGVSNYYHYYVGENYHAALPTNAGSGALITNATANANTLIVVKVTPKATAPQYIQTMGNKYYTLDLNNAIAQNAYNALTRITSWTDNTFGFSTKRKTNYAVTFNLSQIGADKPYIRMKTLNVNVTAEGWDDASTGSNF